MASAVTSKVLSKNEPFQLSSRKLSQLWNGTESLLDCNFQNGPCYWQQQIDHGYSFPSWNHVFDPPGLSIFDTENSKNHDSPKLVSPYLRVDERYCFSFNYSTNATLVLLEESADVGLQGHALFHVTRSSDFGFATLDIGNYSLIFQAENDKKEAYFVELSNFTVFEYENSICMKNDPKIVSSEAEGNLNVMIVARSTECKWVDFKQPFSQLPHVVVHVFEYGIKTQIKYVSKEGFRLCTTGTYSNYFTSANIDWRASVTDSDCFSRDQYKCSSGECISRRAICDGHADCISADDENTDLCATAMGTLAFSTFMSTIMTTYLITYLKYVRDIRQVFLEPLNREEDRLESIHMRELSRETQQSSSINIPVN